MRRAAAGMRVAAAALACAACTLRSERPGDGTPAAAPPAAEPDGGPIRLLDRLADWTIESPWSPSSEGRAEERLAPGIALDFENGLPDALSAAALAAPLPGTPPLPEGVVVPAEPAGRVAAEAAFAGRGGLRFEHASGVGFAIVPIHPETPYVFSARVRRGVEPGRLAAGGDDEERARNAAALERDGAVGRIVLLELNELPPSGTTIDALLRSFAERQNALVAPHVLAPESSARGAGEWRELRLELRTSVFTHALAIGLVAGNPGWWRLPASARAEDAPPAGSVDFDEVALFELPLARWLATERSRSEDELPCTFAGDGPGDTASGDGPARQSLRPFLRKVALLRDARRALLAPPGTSASVSLELPRGRFRLSFAYGVIEERRPGFGTEPIGFVARLERAGAPPRELLRASVRAAQSAAASAWQELALVEEGDGGEARLVLETSGDAARGEVAAFAEPRLEALQPADELPWNVLLVSIDTLRADRLGCYGYERADGESTSPALDEFARESLRFASARTVAPYTLPAHATMLTGLPPRVHRVTRQGRRLTPGLHPILTEEFAAAGYATGAFTGGAFVSYEHGFHHGFDRYSILDPFLTEADPYRDTFPRPGDRAWNDAAYAHHGRAAIERWIDAQAGRPFFLFVHTYVAHNYRPPAAIERRFVRGDPDAVLGPARDLKWIDLNVAAAGGRIAPEVARVASDVYDAAVATADAEVGALLAALRARGLLDRTVVAIVSDHGEELGEHGGLLHGRTLYEELLRVPFLLRVPGLEPGVVDEPVDLVDLAPTLREAAGLAAERRCDGRSVLARRRDGGFEESLWAEVSAPGLSRRHALFAGRLKLIESPATSFEEAEYARRRPPELELFDLAADREERRNLVRLDAAVEGGRPELRPDSEQPAVLAAMRRAVAQRKAALDARRDELLPDARALDYAASGDSRRMLQAMGYAAGAGDGAESEEE